MNIGFDAKRFFHNSTGLGNYSRTLVNGLAHYFPEHDYYLFNPKLSKKYFKPELSNVHEILPSGIISKNLTALWRSGRVVKDLEKLKIGLYHGLSHEIPVGIQKTKIPSVVTIHDLIFERYPQQFSRIDVQIYRKKFRYACTHANRIIAISQQTKQDIIDLYGIDENRIDICYQSCNPAFGEQMDEPTKETIREKYQLPQEFFLYVGSIIERKNLLNICKAMMITNTNIPLVVIGDGKDYKKKVVEFIAANGLEKKIIFLSNNETIKQDPAFQNPKTFAVIYQMAVAMIYPSFFEGFGLPVLEALWSRLPVITSNVSCLPETGGNAAYYVDPSLPEQIAEGMKRIYNDEELRNDMKLKGWQYAQNFSLERSVNSVMEVYKKITHV